MKRIDLALALPAGSREALAGRLLESLHDDADALRTRAPAYVSVAGRDARKAVGLEPENECGRAVLESAEARSRAIPPTATTGRPHPVACAMLGGPAAGHDSEEAP